MNKQQTARSLAQDWFAERGWSPFSFQREAWEAFARGESGVVQASTGMGKSYAGLFGPLQAWLEQDGTGPGERGRSADELAGSVASSSAASRATLGASSDASSDASSGASSGATTNPQCGKGHKTSSRSVPVGEPINLLWITPLRSLANDLAESLRTPIDELGLPWTVEVRTGDTSSALKKRQRERLPTLLITTPESLSILLSYRQTRDQLQSVCAVVVDEWHELIGTKRGVQTELALARLRRLNPKLQTWGLSATLGNLEQAVEVLVGRRHPRTQSSSIASSETLEDSSMSKTSGGPSVSSEPCVSRERMGSGRTHKPSRPRMSRQSRGPNGTLIRDPTKKRIELETVFPEHIDRYPWHGHLGIRLLPEVLLALDGARTTLLFTTTRAQAEIWCRAICDERPDWATEVGLHHGSIEQADRQEVEQRLRRGDIRCVVCTASLDLGVDFTPVDQVIQVGSPLGLGRLIQRAGRSGHSPGEVSRVLCIPTNAFELIEFSAARAALDAEEVEAREPIRGALDVLAQHVVTMSLASPIDERELFQEVRETYAYAELDEDEWEWVLEFVAHGGETLRGYDRYARLTRDPGGSRVSSPEVAKQHRMSIGTIASEMAFEVRFKNGKKLGTIEESFIAKVLPGERFHFAGKLLELVRIQQMTVWVRPGKGGRGKVAVWGGGRMPLSTQLARRVLQRLAEADAGKFVDHEMRAIRPIIEVQKKHAALPSASYLAFERTVIDGAHSWFLFPFQGRLVHEGIAALLAFRATQLHARSVVATVNDYGIELASPEPMNWDEATWRRLLAPEELVDELLECINSSVLTRRQFREVSRIAGLVFSGFPGRSKTARQLQASSELLFDMFERYDPQNLLMEQARREVLDRQLEVTRLRESLSELSQRKFRVSVTERLTPFSFPLWAESIQAQALSSESWSGRVKRMVSDLEAQEGDS